MRSSWSVSAPLPGLRLATASLRPRDTRLALTGVEREANCPLFRRIGRLAAHARRADDIDAVGDLSNVFDTSQKFLQQLL